MASVVAPGYAPRVVRVPAGCSGELLVGLELAGALDVDLAFGSPRDVRVELERIPALR